MRHEELAKVQDALNATAVCDKLTGKRTNHKSNVFSTHPDDHKKELARLHYNGMLFERVDAEKLVGIEHDFRRRWARGFQEKRSDASIDT